MGRNFKTITEYKGSTNSQELNYWLSTHLMIRRLKKDVLKELPDKLRIKLPIEINPKFKKDLERLMKLSEDLRKEAEEAEGKKITLNQLIAKRNNLETNILEGDPSNPVMELYLQTGLAKVQSGFEFLETLLDAEIKFLLFAHHKAVLDEYEEKLK